METCERAAEKVRRLGQSGNIKAKQEYDLLKSIIDYISENGSIRKLNLEDPRLIKAKEISLLTSKPVIYIANTNDLKDESNPHLIAVKKIANAENSDVIALSATMEAELSELDEQEQLDFLSDAGLEEPGLNRLIKLSYDALGLETYFTAGVKEVRAWTILKNTKAPQAAGVIHTDFERCFIRAEVISYEEFIQSVALKPLKKMANVDKKARNIVKDADVINFLVIC